MLAIFEPVVNEHGWAADTGERVKRFPLLRPLRETMVGGVVGVVAEVVVDGVVAMSPNCRATAV